MRRRDLEVGFAEVADLAEPELEPADLDEAAALWADADLVDDLARVTAPAANDHDAQLDEPPLVRVDVDAVREQHVKRAATREGW